MPAFFGILLLASLATTSGYKTKPDIHGDLAVFTCEGDLWIGSISDHNARRLTSHEGVETNARFSPDGKLVAFNAYYDGSKDVYVMSIDGGMPRRLTYDPTGADVLDWTPDGKGVVFRSTRFDFERRLWVAPLEGGPARQIPVPTGYFASYSEDGQLAYVPTSFEWANWYRYKGGGADDIWLYRTEDKSFTQLTTDLGVDTTPVWCAGSIYYVSERTGYSNIWRINPKTKATTQVTKLMDGPIRYPGSDHRRVVFQCGGDLSVYDPQSNSTTDLVFNLNSDLIHERPALVPVSGSVNYAALGPSGKRLALEVRGQIVSVPASDGELRLLEDKPGTRAMFPVWSPDGKKVAFVSDRTGENEIWLDDAANDSEAVQLTKGLKANPYALTWSPDGSNIATGDRDGRILLVHFPDGKITVLMQAPVTGSYDSNVPTSSFSPDGKYLTFQSPFENWLLGVYVASVQTGAVTLVSSPDINSYAPIFDATGKFVVYLADRSLSPFYTFTHRYSFDKVTRVNMVALAKATPSPFLPKNDEEGTPTPAKPEDKNVTVFEPEGIQSRVFEVPMPAGRYRALESVSGRLLLIDADQIAGMDSPAPGVLRSFDLDKKTLATIAENVDSVTKTPDGKKLLIRSGGNIHVADASLSGPLPAPIRFTGFSISVDPRSEWRQMFNETWRIARDFFYDPGMHGVDWNAVRAKYEPMLKMVGDRADLTRLLKDMVSELNCGHAYVSNPPIPGVRVSMGYLGIEADPVPGTNAIQVRRILRGDDFSLGVRSPLEEPGVNVRAGDYILSIGGQRVSANQDFQALLVGKTGQTITLVVNSKPTMDGARTVRVRPLSSEAQLRYIDWVQGRIEYVSKNGGANFGYAHISDMGSGGLIGFTKGQFQNVYKDAMIYDTRFNGGGFVSSMLLENIAAKPQAWWKPRTGSTWTREDWANLGYSAAICNQGNFSDGELFVEVWKRMKLGPVVGTRTGGGEVGSGGGYTLVDGGTINIPNYAAFADGKWLIEGVGAIPDFNVSQDPAAVMGGRDPQLDKAIELLKAKLAKNPIKKPEPPAFPKKGIGG